MIQTEIDDVIQVGDVLAEKSGQVLVQIHSEFMADKSGSGNQCAEFGDFHVDDFGAILFVPGQSLIELLADSRICCRVVGG